MWSYLIFLVLYVAKNNIYSNEKKNLNYDLFYLSHKFRTLSCVPHWEVCCYYFFFPTVYVKYNFYPGLFGDVILKYKSIHSLSTRNDTREGISAQDKFSFASKKFTKSLRIASKNTCLSVPISYMWTPHIPVVQTRPGTRDKVLAKLPVQTSFCKLTLFQTSHLKQTMVLTVD